MYSTGPNSHPGTVTVGDFNEDQQMDIAVVNFGSNNIRIFFGLGNGYFVNETIISTGSSRPIWLHIIDVNNDTFLDIVTADYGRHSISILRGYGNGSFTHGETYPTGYDSFPTSVISADLNNDHLLDLIIANAGTNNIGILFARVNGTFFDQITFSTDIASHPQSIAVGDFNKDTFLDIVVANTATKNIALFLNAADGTFTKRMIHLPDGDS